jgi:thiamine-monophosphate kinase
MMDVSDGLAKDLNALTPSGAVPALDPDTLPLRRGADLRAALTDGEDYELVFALAARTDATAFAAAWRRAFPRTRLTRIGCFALRGALPPSALRLNAFSGYEHLR